MTPLQAIIGNIASVEEARFLLEKLCGTAISQACDVAINENKLKEKEALLTEVFFEFFLYHKFVITSVVCKLSTCS